MNQIALNRPQLLAAATVLLLIFAVIYHIWADWGLITIHARQEPLDKVIASMERQGHARIETDMPGDTPVTMDVVKATVTDALETLSVNTDSRWRLLYFAAADKTMLKTAEASWFAGQRPDDWKMVSFPMGDVTSLLDNGSDTAPLDPRGDVWTPRTAAPAPVQTFLTEAAQATNAGFAYPQDWNPTVSSAPVSGAVSRVIPKLISAAGGKQEGFFFLSKPQRRAQTATAGDDASRLRPDFDLVAERMQGEINRLPPEERAVAQSNFDTQQAFRKSLANMTDDDRRAAWLKHMQDPQFQQMMANQLDSRDARMNHEQRMSRVQNYVSRKLTALGKL